MKDAMSDVFDEGKVIEQALKAVARRSLFGIDTVPLDQDFVLRIVRDWTEPTEDVTDQIKIALYYVGPLWGKTERREYSVISCDGMLEVVTTVSRLIEDRKRLRWNSKEKRWMF